MKIVITIPAYNEENTIGDVLKKCKAAVPSATLLVVDDGSSDNTVKIAKKLGAKVVSHPKNYGLAETFRTEMKTCVEMKADIIVHIDADNQYVPAEIPKLIKPIKEKKADLVLGSRFKGSIEYMPFVNRWGNKAFSKVISQITRMKIHDAQTGFRAFTREVAKLPMSSDHTYTQEQIIRGVKEKFRIVEVPIHFAKRKDKSRLISSPFEYAIRAWVTILKIHRDYDPVRFFGIIGASFMGVGVLLGLWIVYTLIQEGRVGGIPRVILSALFILTGIQIALFGFFADMKKK